MALNRPLDDEPVPASADQTFCRSASARAEIVGRRAATVHGGGGDTPTLRRATLIASLTRIGDEPMRCRAGFLPSANGLRIWD
jgi:hypothetical protein